jgi:hypothetical protein
MSLTERTQPPSRSSEIHLHRGCLENKFKLCITSQLRNNYRLWLCRGNSSSSHRHLFRVLKQNHDSQKLKRWILCILYNQRDATYTMFFVIISAIHVTDGFSAHHQELIKLYVQPWVLSCFPAVCITRCVFYITNDMQLIQCSLLLLNFYMFRAVFPPIITSL